jgi:hypothetical protein
VSIAEEIIDGFPVDTWVLVAPPNDDGSYMRPKIKTHMLLEGPFRVIKVVKDSYTLADPTKQRDRTVHVSRLRPFIYDPEYVDPQTVQLNDTGEYTVKEVLQHQGDPKGKRKDLKFLIHWDGYDDPADYTWEEWNGEWGRTEAMIDYLRRNRMSHLISRNLDPPAPAVR